ncbi:MAG TPA: DUF2141 domain-containing protein [Sphingomicrobium sp.]
MSVSAILMLLFLAPTEGEQASVELDLQNLRNSRGLLQLCITANAAVFPDCSRDPQAIKRSFPAGLRKLAIPAVPPGHYAITLFHDENANRKLDTMLGIPREGFGFSRSPVVRFGAPKFNQVGIDLKAGINRQVIKLQYLL